MEELCMGGNVLYAGAEAFIKGILTAVPTFRELGGV